MLKIVKISLNICYLRSIVNKIWAHEILNYFSFHFTQIIKKKTLKEHSQHFWNLGCKAIYFI